MNEQNYLRWILELIDAQLAENLERQALEQIEQEFGRPGGAP